MKIKDEVFNQLTDEQKEKVKAAKTPQELLALAKEAGYVLSEDQLQMLVGGGKKNFCNDLECYTQTLCWDW